MRASSPWSVSVRGVEDRRLAARSALQPLWLLQDALDQPAPPGPVPSSPTTSPGHDSNLRAARCVPVCGARDDNDPKTDAEARRIRGMPRGPGGDAMGVGQMRTVCSETEARVAGWRAEVVAAACRKPRTTSGRTSTTRTTTRRWTTGRMLTIRTTTTTLARTTSVGTSRRSPRSFQGESVPRHW